MGDFLTESGNRARRPGIVTAMMRSTTNKYWQDINVLMNLVDESMPHLQSINSSVYTEHFLCSHYGA